ncbi:MAG: DUF2809 domain-containing protein [Clostridia bacterium]|nr:DUF2809 domain-containing protein [Clostridia bacterium]
MSSGLKIRLPYLILAAVLLVVEVLIGAFVHDDFIRPFVGDVLVTMLLCALVRVIFPNWRYLVPCVLCFSFAVEMVQLIPIDIENAVLRIALGSTFDVIDLVCYTVGCLLFFIGEKTLKRI